MRGREGFSLIEAVLSAALILLGATAFLTMAAQTENCFYRAAGLPKTATDGRLRQPTERERKQGKPWRLYSKKTGKRLWRYSISIGCRRMSNQRERGYRFSVTENRRGERRIAKTRRKQERLGRKEKWDVRKIRREG